VVVASRFCPPLCSARSVVSLGTAGMTTWCSPCSSSRPSTCAFVRLSSFHNRSPCNELQRNPRLQHTVVTAMQRRATCDARCTEQRAQLSFADALWASVGRIPTRRMSTRGSTPEYPREYPAADTLWASVGRIPTRRSLACSPSEYHRSALRYSECSPLVGMESKGALRRGPLADGHLDRATPTVALLQPLNHRGRPTVATTQPPGETHSTTGGDPLLQPVTGGDPLLQPLNHRGRPTVATSHRGRPTVATTHSPGGDRLAVRNHCEQCATAVLRSHWCT
jgi:hypothetical protein